jgi:hypothetical protein
MFRAHGKCSLTQARRLHLTRMLRKGTRGPVGGPFSFVSRSARLKGGSREGRRLPLPTLSPTQAQFPLHCEGTHQRSSTARMAVLCKALELQMRTLIALINGFRSTEKRRKETPKRRALSTYRYDEVGYVRMRVCYACW